MTETLRQIRKAQEANAAVEEAAAGAGDETKTIATANKGKTPKKA